MHNQGVMDAVTGGRSQRISINESVAKDHQGKAHNGLSEKVNSARKLKFHTED